MELRRAALVFTLAAGSQLFAAEAGIEFSGVLTAEGTTRIALTDVATRSTTWVRAGDIFNGYTVARYDAKEDAVLLTKGGQELRLRLELPKTPDAGRPNSAVATASPNAAGSTGPVNSAANPPSSPATPTAAATIAASPSATPAATPPAASAAPNPPSVAGTAPAPTTQSPPPVPANSAPPPPAPNTTSSTASLPAVPESLPPTGRQTASPSYTIQGGDTLDSIALTQGVTVQQIRELNPALNSTSLRAGDTIRIR